MRFPPKALRLLDRFLEHLADRKSSTAQTAGYRRTALQMLFLALLLLVLLAANLYASIGKGQPADPFLYTVTLLLACFLLLCSIRGFQLQKRSSVEK